MDKKPELKPMPFWQALLYFAIPALVVILSVYWLIPAFRQQGMTEYVSYTLALMIPLIIMLAASLVALKLEGYPLTWAAIQDRFRLRKMTRRDWLWVGISLVVALVLGGVAGAAGQILVLNGILPVPAQIPTALIDPFVPPDQILSVTRNAMGSNVVGNWGVVLLMIVLLFFNIIGEEFWWRGLIMPRQELVHGKNTWLIHGTMWALFHAFKYWQWLALWPVTLIISYVAQKQKNTWPGIVTHFIVNGFSLFPITAMVLGLL